MLTDSSKLKTVKSPKKRVNDTQRWYSDSQKLEAVKLWLLTGNLAHTAAALNLPGPTLRNWRYSDWWKDLVEELKAEENIQLNNRLKIIAEKSMMVLEDRLDKGDWIFNRQTGELERKPVSLRDTTQAFNSLHDRRQRLLETPRDKEDNKQVVDRLAALAAKFEEIAGKKQPIQVTDVIFAEDKNALHEGRQEGLPSGVSLGAQEQTEPSQGQSSPKLSPEESRT